MTLKISLHLLSNKTWFVQNQWTYNKQYKILAEDTPHLFSFITNHIFVNSYKKSYITISNRLMGMIDVIPSQTQCEESIKIPASDREDVRFTCKSQESFKTCRWLYNVSQKPLRIFLLKSEEEFDPSASSSSWERQLNSIHVSREVMIHKKTTEYKDKEKGIEEGIKKRKMVQMIDSHKEISLAAPLFLFSFFVFFLFFFFLPSSQSQWQETMSKQIVFLLSFFFLLLLLQPLVLLLYLWLLQKFLSS